MTRSTVGQRLERLVGRRIVAVRYVELAYESPGPHWKANGFDAIDHGVELELHGGETWSITWAPPAETEQLTIVEGPLIPQHVHDGVVWPLDAEWFARGPHDVASIRAVWTHDAFATPGSETAADDTSVAPPLLASIVISDRGNWS